MPTDLTAPQGLWLPLITPFKNGAFDEASAQRLVSHYTALPVDGFILGATTGEGLTLDEDEAERFVDLCRQAIDRAGRRAQLYFGLSGSDTRKVVKALSRTSAWPVDGYLIVSPYYTRPSQLGLYRHFATLAESTSRPIMLYNIPYRTGVNLGNEQMLRLAAIPNIVGVKDCSADAEQSFDLIRSRPSGFAVLTGEDALFHGALAQGADGGVVASAHIQTAAFADIGNRMRGGDHAGALAGWRALVDLPRLLFTEPSPSPIKHWLWRSGLIDSPEVRLPMTTVSDALAARIDQAIARSGGRS